MTLYWVIPILLILLIQSSAYGEYICDDGATHDNVKLSKLTPNMFHQICPRQTSGRFGQPGCGDGTAFSFFVAKPPQKKANDRKILIEFQGGGACWDSETCDMQSDALTFPTQLSNFVGLSCTEIQYGSSNGGDGENDYPINMLCAQQIGEVDFTEYTTIIVPYCTQDVHVGDATVVYEQGETVQHKGAHNMLAVLRWVFANFRHPSHIALTGCSAGGTPLPIAYDLLNKHYNSFLKGGRSVQISVLSDSPVYLTPEYFLENGLANWNPAGIMKRIRFNYERNRDNEEYPTLVWDHVLKRGSNRDQWGLVTHTSDPVSLKYYQWMSGNGGERRLDDGEASEDQWWSELSNSLSTIQQKHRNVDTFLIQDEGHCSFGLYYPLQVDGFEDWAASVFHENNFLGSAHLSVPLFVASVTLGALLVAGVVYATRNGRHPLQLDDSMLINDKMILQPQWKQAVVSFFIRFRTFPVTAGYFVATTVYFFAMIIVEGFAHPINNPSLGPSAQGLSSFGINNPTLIVYKNQYSRLITSNLLCSGVLTYLMVLFCVWKQTRYIEEKVNNTWCFSLASVAILLGSNLFYAAVVDGASCASLSLILGINVFSIAMNRKHAHAQKQENLSKASEEELSEPVVEEYSPPGESSTQLAASESSPTDEPLSLDNERDGTSTAKEVTDFPMPWVTTLVFSVLTSIMFPFNSWVMLLSGLAIGSLVVPVLFLWGNTSEANGDDASKATVQLRPLPVKVLGAVYLIMFLVLLFRVRKPDEKYEYSYLTGCELVYTLDVGDIVGNYNGGNGGNRRYLGEDDGDLFENACAQLCIPHVAYRPALWGIKKFVQFSVDKGTCEENGYEEHIADKTFSFMSYSLDVELYSMGGYDRDRY